MDKLLCDSCGCLFPSEDFASNTCPDCLDRGAGNLVAEKRLRQVQIEIGTVRAIIKAVWDTRMEHPTWFLTLPRWCVILRALYASEHILLARFNGFSCPDSYLHSRPWEGTSPNSGRVSPDLR